MHEVGGCIARNARTRDLSIVAISTRIASQRPVAEEVIFGAGRPVVVFNPERSPLPLAVPDRVAVLWDGSRCAARTAADALPLLARAREVRVVTIVGEKPSAGPGLAADLIRHFKAHDVTAQVDEIEAAHRSIGQSIDAYIEEQAPQLLVMGAYGTSKLREFVLGGATEHVLNDLRVPALFSH